MSEMFILMILSFNCMIFFLMSKHPLTKGVNLLIHTILISLMSLYLNFNSWYSYILFLIMIGGMLILFIYMTSIVSNEKFNFKVINLISLIMTNLLMLMILIMDNFYLYLNIHLINLFNFDTTHNFEYSMNKFMNYPHNMIIIMMIMYLLITLIMAVKTTASKIGPLRKIF